MTSAENRVRVVSTRAHGRNPVRLLDNPGAISRRDSNRYANGSLPLSFRATPQWLLRANSGRVTGKPA